MKTVLAGVWIASLFVLSGPQAAATFTASLVAYGDRLLATSEDGDTFVIKAGAVHEIVPKRQTRQASRRWPIAALGDERATQRSASGFRPFALLWNRR
jgi:hypothetical protein